MTTKNPFRGMNPFFEQRWRDAHTRLITYLSDAIQLCLPSDLVAGAEERIVAIGTGGLAQAFRPDVQVREPWRTNDTGSVAVAARSPSMVATEPIRMFVGEEIERWIEIHDETGRLITVLEILSPGNKVELSERERYRNKRLSFISGGVNLVEMDLVRQGSSVFPDTIRDALRLAGASYAVSVLRATQPSDREVYPICLRDRLPVIRIPLRPADADLVLELQPLIDQCHERGRYHRLDYRADPAPPLSAEDAAWVERVLREHGLR